MNYLLDRKAKKRKWTTIGLIVIVVFLLFYFHAGIFNGLSRASETVFRPVLSAGRGTAGGFQGFASFFLSKRALMHENQALKDQLDTQAADMANYNSVLAQNADMKDTLDRKSQTSSLVLAAILSKPDVSPYDTLLIDIGDDYGLKIGDIVFALGNSPIGRVGAVYAHTAKVVLFSSPGEVTQVTVPGAPTDQTDQPVGASSMQVTGRGGGNFEMILPRDFTIAPGAEADLPGITPYVVGTVATIISDPRDAFTKALLVAPVNVETLQFVEVEQ